MSNDLELGFDVYMPRLHKKSRIHDLPNTLKNLFYSLTSLPNENGCLEWFGSKNSHGYGQISRYKDSPVLATRFSYLLHYGVFNRKLWVLHKCDNPACVNPEHLFLGNRSMNMRDCFIKGRLWLPNITGENNPSAILSNKDVLKIKKFLKEGVKAKDLASKYNCHTDTIYAIKTNKNWSTVQ